jgi:3-deoxy-D-manno-octulosonic-acid transferase
MGLLYRAFPLVVMGKSFGEVAQGGGQNPWEPAQLGCAVICGPHMQNFAEAVARLSGGGALLTAADTAELVPLLDGLLADPVRLAAMGAAARQVTGQQSGLPEQLAGRLVALLDHR